MLTGSKNGMTKVNETIVEQLKAFETRIEQKIEDTKKEINTHVPKAMEECINTVTGGGGGGGGGFQKQ